MKEVHLLVISPYKGLDEIITNLLSKRDDVTADFYVANLSAVVPLLKEINVFDYDAIISRGGTASLLDSLVSIPVYDIGLSALDALRAITLAQNFSQKLSIIGFENITKVMFTLSEILHWDYKITTITKEEEAEPALRRLRSEGTGVVVCDTISALIAPSLGMNAVLVTSGYETVESALSQTIKITKRYIRNRQDMTHLTTAFHTNPYACTILDRDGKIILSQYQVADPNHILSYIEEHKEELLKEDSADFERAYRGGVLSFVVNKRFLQNEQYTYLYCRLHERLEARKIDAITQLSGDADDMADFAFYNSSHYMTSTHVQIDRFSKTLTPVVLSGEEGTGKDQAAYFIYRRSAYQNSIFYQIDCETATTKNWNYLFTHHESPLMHNKHTLYFRHVDQLPYTIFRKLLSVISDSNMAQRNRLIFSFIAGDQKTANSYMKDLTKTINCLTLRLPSLRERSDDIPYLCTLYINRLNAKLGKQIVGFDNKAMKAMKTFLWEGNLVQFQRIIESLMLVTDTSYITYESTMRQLSQESALWATDGSQNYQFNLEQTLDDINYDIIRQVLKSENNNHSKAAERLGISRSTLWRILKNHE